MERSNSQKKVTKKGKFSRKKGTLNFMTQGDPKNEPRERKEPGRKIQETEGSCPNGLDMGLCR